MSGLNGRIALVMKPRVGRSALLWETWEFPFTGEEGAVRLAAQCLAEAGEPGGISWPLST